MNFNLDRAILGWKELLGEDAVLGESELIKPHTRNITEFHRSILAVLTPDRVEDLARVLEIARHHGIALTPFSQGKNWGQGSMLPAQDGTVVLKLDRLNRIILVNERLRYAVIEPGVTQRQLATYLQDHHPDMIFNMTGSGLDTSIVGNILERGAAVYGQRIRNLRSMEVLLAGGDTVRTGHWHYDDGCSHHYRHGVGPDLNGLFVQSNLGIVTKMVVDLRPRPRQQLICINFERQHIEAVVDVLFTLSEEQVITAGPVFINRIDHRIKDERSMSTGSDPWLAVTSIAGPATLAEARQRELHSRLSDLPVTVTSYEPEQVDDETLIPFLRTMLELLQGKPSNFSLDMFRRFINSSHKPSDAPEDYVLDRHESSPGMSCVLPAVPFQGTSVDEVINVVQDFSTSLPFQIGFTFVTHDNTTLEGFIRVIFDRGSSLETTTAQKWNSELYRILQDHRYYPYRLHIDAMKHFVDDTSDPFWKTVRKIKDALDPDEILAPGRYCPGTTSAVGRTR